MTFGHLDLLAGHTGTTEAHGGALIARHFAEEKMRLLARARIEDGAVPRELARAVQALTPRQVEDSLNSMLATNPHLLDHLRTSD
jgi:hypothetical protein